MKTKHPKAQQLHILAAASLLVTGTTPYDQLEKDSDGNVIHSGVASGNQAVHSVRSKIYHTGGKYMVILQLGNGGKMTIPAADFEVCAAQLLPELAAINQDAGTTATA